MVEANIRAGGPRSKPGGMRPGSWVQLAGWKTLRAARHAFERGGGARLASSAAKKWAKRWLAQNAGTGITGWLARAEAGTWFELPWAAAEPGSLCPPAELAWAERALRGEFDLLGSGPVQLGETPRWRTDLYSGIEWPLEPPGRVKLVRNDGSDIRTVWELSRCYHFAALARAWTGTGDTRYPDAFVRHVRSFQEQNPIGYGAHWASPMDVAIRCANWCMVLPGFAGAVPHQQFWAELLAHLVASGRWVEAHLEWHPAYRGNHYVANLVGLAYLGTLFRGTREGDRWLALAARRLPKELDYQITPEGVGFEGALAYHRLDTELFAWAGELLVRNVRDFPAATYQAEIRRMADFIGAYLQPDGQAPMLGDADDGRLHAFTEQALLEPRRHALGLPATLPVVTPADGAYQYPEGGFCILRGGADHAAIRCGPVGLKGAGSHDHNDQLSFDLVIGGRRIVSDSGTFGYTRDLRARHAFRATAAHSLVQVEGQEQNPIAVERPWRVLEDRTRSRIVECSAAGGGLVFVGDHRGYADLPQRVVCRRTLKNVREGTWLLEDKVQGTGEVRIDWRLQLATKEAAMEQDSPGSVKVSCSNFPHLQIQIMVPEGLLCSIESRLASDSYGKAEERQVVLVCGRARLPAEVRCTFQQDSR